MLEGELDKTCLIQAGQNLGLGSLCAFPVRGPTSSDGRKSTAMFLQFLQQAFTKLLPAFLAQVMGQAAHSHAHNN